ncbi:MAG: TetR/AcrR family transcriptional regulator [Lyngbya sp.]|nr:TetR/AcrR family transcriptional regulator [Lyngbya sp.]
MKGNTAEQILDVAQDLVQNRGYNAFSYADISEQVKIRKASIHYHFPSKDDLVRELVKRYREIFNRIRQQIEQKSDSPKQQLRLFANLYREGLSQDKLCLCGMLTSDWAVLPEAVREEIKQFFSENQTWLAGVLETGCQAGIFHCKTPYEMEAKRILATFQGAQLFSRLSEDRISAFEQMIQPLFAELLNEQ